MSESENSAFMEKKATVEEQGRPPLSISHLLMFITGIGVAMAIRYSGRASGKMDRYQAGDDFLVTLRAMAIGCGVTFIAWLLLRAWARKSVALIEPSARFIIVVIAAEGLFWLSRLAMLAVWHFNLPQTISLLVACLVVIFGVFVMGFIWIKDGAWRVVLVCQVASLLCAVFPMSSLIASNCPKLCS